MTTTHKRVQVPMDPQAADLIAAARASHLSPEVRELLGPDLPTSDAGFINRLVSLGLQHIREAQQKAGYRALAKSLKDDPAEVEYVKASRVHRNRQAAHWADA